MGSAMTATATTTTTNEDENEDAPPPRSEDTVIDGHIIVSLELPRRIDEMHVELVRARRERHLYSKLFFTLPHPLLIFGLTGSSGR